MTPSTESRRRPWTAANLKAWRDRMDLSQADAALALGIPSATLKGYEQGRRYATRGLPEYLSRICRYYERYGALD
jgi:DNA-binding transcriptional regulator YiaG